MKYKMTILPLYDLNIDQAVMYQDITSKHWFPAIITGLCKKTQMLHNHNQRWCSVQENTSTLEALPTLEQEN